MTRHQALVVGSAFLLLAVLYFGADISPKNHKASEKTKAPTTESTDIAPLLREARAALQPDVAAAFDALEKEIAAATSDTAKAAALKKISGAWYRQQKPAAAGHYAEAVAQIEKTESAWSIAGNTFAAGLQPGTEEKEREYCFAHAVRAFENASSLNPSNVLHKINLALCYADHPPQDNPMKGILMLRELNAADPDNTDVLLALAKLALRTGQYDRAVERLEKVLGLKPGNNTAICLLADAYAGAGKQTQAKAMADKCKH